MKTFYEFFAGGGMARLGFGDGWECVFANDVSLEKAAAYNMNFGGRNSHLLRRDVFDVKLAYLPPGRVYCCWLSPPCVGHSEAGNRKGFDEAESRAFWPAWALIEQLNREGRAPLTAVFENVSGIKPENLRAVQAAFARADYIHATRVIDTAHFVPQTRERMFVVGVHRDLNVDPGPIFTAAMEALPRRTIHFVDVIDWDSNFREYPVDEVGRYLTMLSPLQRAELDRIRALGRRVAIPAAKRMRGPKGARTQQIEIQPGLAYALKVVSKGGSSHQFLFIVEGSWTRFRAIAPREAARLMGLPDSYVLPPRSPIEALDLCGDGVAVPVVRFLVERVIERTLANAISRADVGPRTAA
jgi:DNA (cytosine-5)-methyltransferase 1